MTGKDHEQRLEQVIADYLVAEDAGTPQDPEGLVAAHPDLADDLRTFFREHHRIGRLSAPMRAAGRLGATGTDPTVAAPASSGGVRDVSFPPDLAPGTTPTLGATVAPAESPDASLLTNGARVRYFGDYLIRGELGRGGMGVVYSALQVRLDRPVALKMIRAGVLADESELRRFQNEAEAVALLDHPGIVPVYEVGDHEGQRYFSMKLIPGGSLADRLDVYKADPRAAARLMAEVAEAVHHAHVRGILHRDIKPANILLDEAEKPHVTDFGLAKRVAGDAELTASGAILGTPAYMAPEQAGGRRGSVTTATDVYGLGALLYATLTGQGPFSGENVAETLTRLREQAPESIRRRNPAVPRDLEVIAFKCLEKDPLRRYPSAQALADDLRAWLDDRPIAARPVGAAARAWMWCRRRPALAGLIAALALSLVVATGVSIAYARQQAERAKAETLLREEATRERDRSARQAYLSAVNLAHHEWREGNPARTRDLLDSTRPKGPNDLDFRGFEWSYLARLERSPVWSAGTNGLRGSSVGVSPDGTWVAAARHPGDGRPGEIHILDARDGREPRSIAAGRYFGSRVAVSPDGKWIAAGGEGHSVVVWNARDGGEVLRLVGHRDELKSVTFSRDGKFLASVDSTWLPRAHGEVKVWDLAEAREVQTIKIADSLYHCEFSPDGKRLATASTSGLSLWEPLTGKHDRELDTGDFTDAAFSPDGRLLAGATLAGWVGLWDVATGTRRQTLAGHRGEVYRVRFSPDGKALASAGRDRVVRVWDVPEGRVRREYRGHETDVWDVAFTPDGTGLASVSFLDGVVKLWDAGRDQESTEIHKDAPSPDHLPTAGLAFSPDGRVLVAAQEAGSLRAWRMDRKASLFKSEGKTASVRSWVATSPRSDVLATLDETRSVSLRSTSSGDPIRTLEGSEGSRIGAFSPDGQFLAAGHGPQSNVGVWEVASGLFVADLSGHTAPVECLAFSPDGKTLVSGALDSTVRVWDFATRTGLLVYREHSGPIACLALAPDGKTVASAAMKSRLAGEIRLWDATTGRDIRALPGHASFARRVAFLPDGRRLASLGDDGVLKLWDHEAGQETLSIPAQSRNGLGLAVSPDGRTIATSGAEYSVRVWDSTPPAP